jgi:hypothetical protein
VTSFARRNVFLLSALALWVAFDAVHLVGTIHLVGEEARRWGEPFRWSSVWWEFARASAENYKTEAWQIATAHVLDRVARMLKGLTSSGEEA